MIPIKRINSHIMADLITFLNDYFRLIATEINYNLRTKYFETYFERPPVDPKDGALGYFPCRPAATDRPADYNPGGLGQGVYIYLLDWNAVVVPPDPRPGKWHKFNTTPTP